MIKKQKFNWIAFLKAVSVIAIPVALQNLLTTTGSMVDTMMIAPLGQNSVAAIGLCAQFTSLMFSCYWGFVGGGMLFFAQYWGNKDEDGIDRAFGTTFCCMMLVGLTFSVLAGFFPNLIMRLYTDKTALQEIGVGYLKTVAFAYPFQIASMAMAALLRSTEKVRIPLFASIASVATNILLNWILIYGKFGMPEMGVKGAALATVIAAVVNATIVIILSKAQKYPYLFHFRKHFAFTWAWISEYMKKCFPIICNELLIGIGFMIQNVVLGRQSEDAIAALAVFRTLEGLVISFFSGFSNAASVLVGKSIGAGEVEKAYERAKRLILLCGLVIAGVCLTLFAAHKPILTVMSLSGNSYYYGTGMLGIYCIAAIIRMCNWAQNDTFRSAGDTSFGTILEIAFMYILVLPAVCLSGLVFKLPTLIVFACCYIDEPIRIIMMQHHMYSAKWIKPVTPQGQEAITGFMKQKKKGSSRKIGD